MGVSVVDVSESVSCLNVSVISVPAALNRQVYVCIVTGRTLSIDDSIPDP